MAGTGHSYEIGNIGKVRAVAEALAAKAANRDLPLARDWFRRRPFLRFATSEEFVRKARASDLPFADADDGERDIVSSKFAAGADVRMFSEVFFERVGPDFAHVLDWLFELRRLRPADYAKLPRMAPDAVFAAAEAWIPQARGRTTLPPGRTAEVLATEGDLTWFELLDEAALEHEGSFMSHCIGRGAYHPLLSARRARFFSLRDGAGRPLVTTSLWCGRQGLAFDQAKAYWNAAPPRSCLPALAALLNHLDVIPSGGREERWTRILHRKGLGWASIYQSWRKRFLFGLEILHDDVEAIFMSPSRPDTVMCTVVADAARAGLWNAGEDEIRHIAARSAGAVFDLVSLSEDDRLRTEELRAAAELLTTLAVPPTALKQQSQTAGFDSERWASRLVFSNGRWLPWLETLERRSTKDGDYLFDPVSCLALVARGGDESVPLMWIGPRSTLYPGEKSGYEGAGPAVLPMHVDRWRSEDASLCLAAMSAMEVERLPYETRRDHPLREFESMYRPMRLEGGEWRSFSLDRQVVREKIRPVRWEVTGYALTMCHEQDVVVDLRLHEKNVTSLPYGLTLREPAARCLAAYLNRRRIGLAASAFVPRVMDRLPEKKSAERPAVLWNGTKWCVVRSGRDLERFFDGGSPLTKAQAQILMQVLPQDPAPGSASFHLYVRSVFALVRSYDPKSGPAAPLADKLGQHALSMALRHQHLATEAQWKTVVRFVSKAVDEWSRLPKSVLGAVWLHGTDKLREAVFLDACRHLSGGCRDRFVAAFFGKGRHRLADDDRSIRWIDDVYPLLKEDRARNAFINGVRMSTFPDRRHKDVARLRNTLRMIRFDAEAGACSLVDFHLDLVKEALDALETDPETVSAEMTDVARAEIAEIRVIPEQRRARQRARWEQTYRGLAAPADTDVAAATA